jgi:hypothetical protein
MSMSYLKITWRQASEDDPFIYWYEVDEEGYNTRIVTEYSDGRLGFADSCGGSEGEFISPERINASRLSESDELEVTIIKRSDFEIKWMIALEGDIM